MRYWLKLVVGSVFAVSPFVVCAQPFSDPAPPVVSAEAAGGPATAEAYPELKFFAAPKPLPKDAVTHDWESFLGPTQNLISTETRLLKEFPAKGPNRVWEVAKGEGYAGPAISQGRLILFHRVDDKETIDCLEAESGKRYWRVQYPCKYTDRYGYSDGPRCAPVISDSRIYTFGVTGLLHCLDLKTGHIFWKRDILTEFKLSQNFFGVGATPVVEGDKLIINVGAEGGPCVAGFDKKTGKMAWGAGTKWGPSYSSPVAATVHGKRRVFVFAGGESRPPTGGLMCIDPETGRVDFEFSWRGKRFESANASSPLVIGNAVFISECYGAGGGLIDIGEDFSPKLRWQTDELGTHFMTAAHKDGHIYGSHGHSSGPLVCINMKTGEWVWRQRPEWVETIKTAEGERKVRLGMDLVQLAQVDGRTLCLTEWGHLLWLDLRPDGYKELSRCWLFAASQTWTPPVISHGLMYVCQHNPDRINGSAPRLICYDMRE